MQKFLQLVSILLITNIIGEAFGQYGHGGFGYGGHGYAPVVKALPVIPKVAHVPKAVDYYAEPHYTYSYGVNDAYTGDKKSAHETREGGVTKGQYQVLQPDGVLRTVNYVADPVHGFQAVVHNSAPAVHAVAKHVAKVPVVAKAPVYHHGYGHGHGHGHGYAHAVPVVKATPIVKAVSHGHHHGGYPAPYHHSHLHHVSRSSGVTHYAAGAAPLYPAHHSHHGGGHYDGYHY